MSDSSGQPHRIRRRSSEVSCGPDTIRFTGCDLLAVASTYQMKSDFVSDKQWPVILKKRLQGLIWLYQQGSREKRVRPNTIKRRLEALYNKAQTFSKAFETSLTDIYVTERLRMAVKGNEELPDLDIDRLLVEINRPLDKIKATRQKVNWLVEVISIAYQQAEASMPKTGGKRDDAHQHAFVREVDALYRQTASNPTNPYFDAATDKYKGEFLDLLHACLSHIDVYLAHSGLLSLWKRVTRRSA